jgi:hypothetical protein
MIIVVKAAHFITEMLMVVNFASCWIYIGILLGAHPILHISRIRAKNVHVIRS